MPDALHELQSAMRQFAQERDWEQFHSPEHDYRAQWNLGSNGNLWAIADNSVEHVGCIHTSQGLEMD